MSEQKNKTNIEITDDDLDDFLDGVLDNFDNQKIPTVQNINQKLKKMKKLRIIRKTNNQLNYQTILIWI